MRPKPPADVAIALPDTLTQTKTFNEVEENRKKLNDVEERSRRFMRPKPPADVAISLSDTLTQTKNFNEVEESKRNSMK